MSKRIQQGFMKIMPTSLIAILVTGLFLFTAVQYQTVTPTYAAAPTISGLTVQALDGSGNAKVKVMFSEAVSGTSGGSTALDASDFTLAGSDVAGQPITISSVSHQAGTDVAIVTLSGTINVTGGGELTLDCAATSIYDNNGTNACASGIPLDLNGAALDTTVPTINGNSLDMNAGTWTLGFDEPMDFSVNVDETKFTLQDAATATTFYTLTDSTSVWSAPAQLTITLSATDLNAIKSDSGLGTSQATSWLRLDASSGLTDAVQNTLASIADGSALNTSAHTADTTDPTNSIVVANLNADASAGAGNGTVTLGTANITRNEPSKLQILIKNGGACLNGDAATGDLSTFGTSDIAVGVLSSAQTFAAADYVCYRLLDTAGNDTGWTNSTDGQIPATPTGLDLTSGTDSGSSDSDDYTNDTTPDITGSGVNGETVTVYSSVNNNVGSAVVGGGIFTVTTSALTGSNAGTAHSMTAVSTNANGNVSPTSSALAITIDTGVAAAPSVPDMQAASDLGSSSTDNITADDTPTFDITLAEVGSVANLISSVDGAVGTSASPVTASALDGDDVASGTVHSMTATETDKAGNISVESAGLSITVDTAVPTIQGRTYMDDSNDGSVDRLQLGFAENVTWNGSDTGQVVITANSLTGFTGITSLDSGSGSAILTMVANVTTNLTGVSGGTAPTVQYTQSGTAGNRIKDVAGNDVATEGGASAITDGAAPYMTAAIYRDTVPGGAVNQVILNFTESTTFTMNGADWDFGVPGDVNMSGDFAPAECSGSGGNTITCTDVGGSFAADANKTGKQTAGGTEPRLDFTSSANVKDVANNNMASRNITLEDQVGALILSRVTKDTDQGDGAAGTMNGRMDGILATFTEAMDASTVATADFAVMTSSDGALTEAYTDVTDDTTLFFRVTDSPANDTGDLLKLQITGGDGIQDLSGISVVAEGASVSATDGSAPIMYNVIYQDMDGNGDVDRIRTQWTENVVMSSSTLADWTIVGGDINAVFSSAADDAGGDVYLDIAVTSDPNETGSANPVTIAYDNDDTNNSVADAATNATPNHGPITANDFAKPVFLSAVATSDTNVQIQMSEAINTVTFGAASAWTATDITSSAVVINADPTKLDLTVAPLSNTGFTADDFAFSTANGGVIQDGASNAVSFSGKDIADGQAPVLVGAAPVTALKQDGNEPTGETNLWYYYAGDSLELSVFASEPLTEARACVRSITGDDDSLTCSPGPGGDFLTGTLDTDFISTSTTPGGNEYVFDTALAGLGEVSPSTVGGFPMNIALQDANGNWGYGAGGAEALTAVFNVVPTTIDATLGGTTTDWSTITDFTAATNLIFEKTGGGILSFAGPLDLTASATVTALQSLSTNVITAVDNATGAPVLGIRSDNLAAFDTDATLTVHMPTAVRPGLIVYDNASSIIGQVPNDQSGDIVIDGDTLGTFTWNAGAQTLSWTTDGFSSFGSDSTPPTVTDGNISIAGGTGIGGEYKIGDTVTVTWDNSAGGDNNGTDFNNATANLTAFGGGAAVTMTDVGDCGGTEADGIREACYTIDGTEGIDGANLNAVVTAYDLVGNSMTTADTTNAEVDTIAPIIGAPGTFTITLDNNSNGVANIGDTVTYNDGTPAVPDGDNWSVDLTNLTGDATATNAGSPYTVILGTLTGTQTFTETLDDDVVNQVTGNTAGLAVDNRSLLSSTNVQPASLIQSTSNTVTVDFTTSTALPANGKIKVTFGAGFDVTGATGGTCSTMDGTFVTTVAGQIVTITRQNNGPIEAPGAQSCTIDTIKNPSATGTTGVYTILTTTSTDTGIDIDDAVTADTITSSAPPTTQCSDGIDNDGNGAIDFPSDPYCSSASDNLEAYEGTGGGGGGGGASTNNTSNTTTTTAVAIITTLDGNQSYSSPLQFDQADITVDEDNGTSSAQLTNEGSLTLKPNSKSSISASFPPNTTVTGPANWNGRIDPPVLRSLTMITKSGEKIEGSKEKLMRDDVAAIIKVGATVPLQFSQEVTLNIPVDLPDGSVVILYTSLDGNTWEPSGEGVVQNGMLVVKTDHFSYFAVAMTDETKTSAEMAALVEEKAGGFTDIVGHWAEQYINQIRNLGIVSGKTATRFAPNDFITRAELTKIAALAFGVEIDPSPSVSPFNDVPLTAWFAPYVVAARNASIVQGYGDGVFSPNGLVNRAEALKIMLESAGFTATEAEDLFGDVPVNAWYAGYVTFANKNGVVSGKSEGRFAPGENITRAEVAKIAVKVMELHASQVATAGEGEE